ncbi:hypothetical protein [Streptomyces sp. NPDC058614]|uniref:hypothetical protein n=1 Tax=Streptomyces sp. NPDC058614 TaxID=3346557 RepID=UPI00366271BD
MIEDFVRRLPTPMRAPFRLVVHTGKHRGPRFPGQVTVQRFVHCSACGVETAATVHGSVLLCAEGHLVQGAS